MYLSNVFVVWIGLIRIPAYLCLREIYSLYKSSEGEISRYSIKCSSCEDILSFILNLKVRLQKDIHKEGTGTRRNWHWVNHKPDTLSRLSIVQRDIISRIKSFKRDCQIIIGIEVLCCDALRCETIYQGYHNFKIVSNNILFIVEIGF